MHQVVVIAVNNEQGLQSKLTVFRSLMEEQIVQTEVSGRFQN